MKETDFPTKNCRSTKKITQLRQVLKSNGNATFVFEIYIYRTKKYFVKLYKDIMCLTYFSCVFPFCLHHYFMLKSAIKSNYYLLKIIQKF